MGGYDVGRQTRRYDRGQKSLSTGRRVVGLQRKGLPIGRGGIGQACECRHSGYSGGDFIGERSRRAFAESDRVVEVGVDIAIGVPCRDHRLRAQRLTADGTGRLGREGQFRGQHVDADVVDVCRGHRAADGSRARRQPARRESEPEHVAIRNRVVEDGGDDVKGLAAVGRRFSRRRRHVRCAAHVDRALGENADLGVATVENAVAAAVEPELREIALGQTAGSRQIG